MKIIYDKSAKKFIETHEASIKHRIKNGIEGLTKKPLQGDIKTMQGYNDNRQRLRVGKYRIIYRFLTVPDEKDPAKTTEFLHIMNIDSRGDIYK